MPGVPAALPDWGRAVSSSAQGNSLVLPSFKSPWVRGCEVGMGSTPHLPLGNWLQDCTILPPQMPAQAMPDRQKSSSIREI